MALEHKVASYLSNAQIGIVGPAVNGKNGARLWMTRFGHAQPELDGERQISSSTGFVEHP
jgi:hypothetical protein